MFAARTGIRLASTSPQKTFPVTNGWNCPYGSRAGVVVSPSRGTTTRHRAPPPAAEPGPPSRDRQTGSPPPATAEPGHPRRDRPTGSPPPAAERRPPPPAAEPDFRGSRAYTGRACPDLHRKFDSRRAARRPELAPSAPGLPPRARQRETRQGETGLSGQWSSNRAPDTAKTPTVGRQCPDGRAASSCRRPQCWSWRPLDSPWRRPRNRPSRRDPSAGQREWTSWRRAQRSPSEVRQPEAPNQRRRVDPRAARRWLGSEAELAPRQGCPAGRACAPAPAAAG